MPLERLVPRRQGSGQVELEIHVSMLSVPAVGRINLSDARGGAKKHMLLVQENIDGVLIGKWRKHEIGISETKKKTLLLPRRRRNPKIPPPSPLPSALLLPRRYQRAWPGEVFSSSRAVGWPRVRPRAGACFFLREAWRRHLASSWRRRDGRRGGGARLGFWAVRAMGGSGFGRRRLRFSLAAGRRR